MRVVQAERIRIAGERERNKLIRMQEMGRREQEKAVRISPSYLPGSVC